MTLQGATLTKKKAEEIQQRIEYTSIGWGHTFVHVTPSGGVHYTGKATKTNALFIELPAGRGQYILVVLYEYPKGVIMHIYETKPNVHTRAQHAITEIINILKEKD